MTAVLVILAIAFAVENLAIGAAIVYRIITEPDK